MGSGLHLAFSYQDNQLIFGRHLLSINLCLLSPLPSAALNPIFFLLSLQMKPLSAPGPLHSCSFYLECFPSRYPRGFCLHLLSIFSYISYSLSCLKQCLILLAYTHLAYKILGLLPKCHHLMGPYLSHLLNIPCTFIWVEL